MNAKPASMSIVCCTGRHWNDPSIASASPAGVSVARGSMERVPAKASSAGIHTSHMASRCTEPSDGLRSSTNACPDGASASTLSMRICHVPGMSASSPSSRTAQRQNDPSSMGSILPPSVSGCRWPSLESRRKWLSSKVCPRSSFVANHTFAAQFGGTCRGGKLRGASLEC